MYTLYNIEKDGDQMDAAANQLDSYTIEDIYNLPDGQRAELIDGDLYMMATPNRLHVLDC